jgi:hypothetical protein
MWLEGLGELKNAMTPSRIEHAAFRLIVWCLNELRYSVSLKKYTVLIVVKKYGLRM